VQILWGKGDRLDAGDRYRCNWLTTVGA